jgi:hypothetical protein
MSDQRGRLLMAALGFAGSPPSYCSTPGGELVDAPTDAPEPSRISGGPS